MALLLPTLPVDILAGITSYLSDLDIINGLYQCHDPKLNRSLNAGGLTELTISRWGEHRTQLLWHTIASAPFAALRSFTLHEVEFPHHLICDLIRLLPKSLKRLRVDIPEGKSIFTKEIGLDELKNGRPVYQAYGSEAIAFLSDLFPHLLYCYLPPGTMPSEWPTQTRLKFVEMLPRTLTYLHLPALDLLPVSVWNLLPPHLQTLDSAMSSIPTEETLPSSLNDSLRHLDLSKCSLQILPSTMLATGTEESSIAPAESERTIYPPFLESLVVSLSSFPSLATFPSSLTSLKISSTGAPLNVREAMESIPHSLVTLTFESLLLFIRPDLNLDYGESWKHLHRPNIAHLKMKNVVSREMSQVITFVTLLFPNLQEFSYSGKSVENNELGVEDVERFAKLKITKFKAPLHALCFSTPNWLERAFPHLKMLKIQEPSDSPAFQNHFTFEAIPPSVTTLVIQAKEVSDNTLHLLPKSVTRISVSGLAVSGKNRDLVNALGSLCRSSSNSNPPTNGCYTSYCIPRHGVELITLPQLREHQEGESKSVPEEEEAESSPRFTLSLPSGPYRPPKNLVSIIPTFEGLRSLPPTITCLSLGKSVGIYRRTALTIHSTAFPLLKKLRLWSWRATCIPLRDFTHLKSLHIYGDCEPLPNLQAHQALPPNLKCFKTMAYIQHDRCKIALPASLEKLQVHTTNCADAFAPLKSLTSLTFTAQYLVLSPSVWHHLRTSLTQLAATTPLDSSTLELLPLLQLWRNPRLTEDTLDYVYHRNKSGNISSIRLEGGYCQPELSQPATLSKLSGVSTNALTDRDRPTARRNILIAFKMAYPFWSGAKLLEDLE